MSCLKDKYRIGIVGALLLLAGCTSDEPTTVVPSGTPISFACDILDDNGQPTTRVGEDPSRELLTLRNTGFCVFAGQDEATDLDFMYNQQVTYAAPVYPYLEEHWEYSPLKYWPRPVGTMHFHAYAPAVITAGDGINAVTTTAGTVEKPSVPQLTFTIAEKARDITNLLYTSQEVTSPSLTLNFRHALSRLGITMKTSAVPADDRRILLESITLTTGSIAKSGTFTLGATPQWTIAPADKENTRTYVISNDPESETAYAFIHNDVRYVAGLPDKWQPGTGLSTTPVNILSLDDYITWLYLIPQTSLQVECTVKYHECNPATNNYHSEEDALSKTFTINLEKVNADQDWELRIGRTIQLNLTLKI